MKYDIIIIGGGPSGLSMSHYCSKLGLKILVIEKGENIGGCHTVYRMNNLFSEHSPRVYSSAYLNFQNILKDIGLTFESSFTVLKHQSFDLMKESVFKVFSITEILQLSLDILTYLVYSDHGLNITVSDHYHDFSPESRKVIDTICRMTDGCTSETISLNTFLKYIDHQMLYQLYVPNKPNDEYLLPKWKQYLEKNNVTFLTSSFVEKFEYTDNKIYSCNVNIGGVIKTFYANKFIIAIPPKNIVTLLKRTNIVNAFGKIEELEKHAIDTEYINYITMTFHWDSVLNIEDKYVFPSSEWGIFNKVMSKYMTFKEKSSKTVISVAVSLPQNKSSTLNKTAYQCSRDELIHEVYDQMKKEMPGLTNDYIAILEPGTIWNKEKQILSMNGTGYVSNINTFPIDFQSSIFNNLYNLGTHNGKSYYKPTTFESAVSNANVLSRKLFPELEKQVRFRKIITLRMVFIWICIFIFVIYVYLIISSFYKYMNHLE